MKTVLPRRQSCHEDSLVSCYEDSLAMKTDLPRIHYFTFIFIQLSESMTGFQFPSMIYSISSSTDTRKKGPVDYSVSSEGHRWQRVNGNAQVSTQHISADKETMPDQHHDSNPGFCEQQSAHACAHTHTHTHAHTHTRTHAHTHTRTHAHMYTCMHWCNMLVLISYQVHSWVCWGPDILRLAFPPLVWQHLTTLLHTLIYPGSSSSHLRRGVL